MCQKLRWAPQSEKLSAQVKVEMDYVGRGCKYRNYSLKAMVLTLVKVHGLGLLRMEICITTSLMVAWELIHSIKMCLL